MVYTKVILFIAILLVMGNVMGSTDDLPVSFNNQTAELGLVISQTEAACWVDIDNDGWVDLCAGGTIWKNNAGKSFTKLMDGVGSVVAADFDNDGFVDLFSWSQIRLYRNIKGKGFTAFPVTAVLPKSISRGACWGDFDNDGFADLYIGGFEDWDTDTTYPDMILTNIKGKDFKLVWSEVRYRARGVTACDFNQDHNIDIYVSNYRLQPNILWLNDGKVKFSDVTAEYNAVATSTGFDGGHSIGAAWGDFDNDGNFDLFAGNFAHVDDRGDQPKSRFLRNLGAQKKYKFDDLGTCGVYYQESYASPSVGDYDNDGNLDLFFTTVYGSASFGKKNFPVLYRNEGKFVFTDVNASAKLIDLAPTYQSAWADFNNDGNLDLVSAGALYVNQGSSNNWMKIKLSGDGRVINKSAIGAQVRIKLKDKILTRQVESGTGEGNQNDLTMHFGLGKDIKSVNFEIVWPNGSIQKVRNAKTNRLVSITFRKYNLN